MPEPYVRQEALEDHFVGLLRRLRCSEQDFQPVRQAIANASAEDSRIQPISTFRDKAYLAGKPGALAQHGTARCSIWGAPPTLAWPGCHRR